jgi:transcriptional regulator with XRE-family HTH domain
MAVQSCGLSLSRLAELAHVSKGDLSRFQRGKSIITLDTAEALAAVLGLELTQGRRLPKPQADGKG